MDLFNEQNIGALFSDCRKYRIALWRFWDPVKPRIMFIGLNPSTANEYTDDPTIRRVKKFAADWGYGGVYMMNLFTYVTPFPEELMRCEDPIYGCDIMLKEIAEKCDKIIFAWGSFKEAEKRAREVMSMFEGYALVINSDGSPRHPLYVKSDVEPVKIKTIKS